MRVNGCGTLVRSEIRAFLLELLLPDRQHRSEPPNTTVGSLQSGASIWQPRDLSHPQASPYKADCNAAKK